MRWQEVRVKEVKSLQVVRFRLEEFKWNKIPQVLSTLLVSGSKEEEEEEHKKAWSSAAGGGLFVDEFIDFDAPFNCRLSLKDFDTLIHDLDRELAKQINICL